MRRVLLLVLCITVAVAGCSDAASGPVDPALAGTWRATGTLFTSSMSKTGEFRLRILRDGRYALVSSPGAEFVIDGGRFGKLSGDSYLRRTATGVEDRGSVARAGEGWRLAGTFGAIELQPAAADAAQDAALDRVATLFSLQGLNSVGAWTARAQQAALLWRADARLTNVVVLDFDADGALQPNSSLNLHFYSPSANRVLLLSPPRVELPALVASEYAPHESTPTRGIPVPIRDLQTLVRAARAAGEQEPLVNANLRFFDESGRGAKLLWMAHVSGSMRRWCLTGTSGEMVDCRQWAGDPEAELEALAQRAAAGWRRLQQIWNPAPAAASSVDLTLPPSDFDRCSGAGGRMDGADCYNYYGERIRP